MTRISQSLIRAAVVSTVLGVGAIAAKAETLPWQRAATPGAGGQETDAAASYGGPSYGGYGGREPRVQETEAPVRSAQASGSYANEPAPDPYRPGYVAPQPAKPRYNDAYSPNRYSNTAPAPTYREPAYQAPATGGEQRYGANRGYEPYDPNYGGNAGRYQNDYGNGYDGRERRSDYDDGRTRMPDASSETYSRNEVIDAGHRFFGSLSSGLAKAVEYVFQQAGRPNGYILGEGAGGAFIAGLRYGEGKLYTKHAGVHRVFWQGPSIGYDFGGDGARTMTLVYNLRSPADIYQRFGGVQGSAYVVGGASVQLLRAGEVTLAPIRTGVGLRLGANIGYLKYTRRPTWNPF